MATDFERKMQPKLSLLGIIGMAWVAAAAADGPLSVSLQVGAQSYSASGAGTCGRSEERDATRYVFRHNNTARDKQDRRFLYVTLQRPKNGGPDTVSLNVRVGERQYHDNGAAQATFEKNGAGGVVTVDAVARSGEKISGTLKCAAFTQTEAPGG